MKSTPAGVNFAYAERKDTHKMLALAGTVAISSTVN